MEPEKIDRISTGSYDLNKWLNGGYEKGVITMIAGPPASGKTNFALLVACSQAKKRNKIIFIDTEGGFSVERVKQIVGEESDEILKQILIFEPTSFEEQKKILAKILEIFKKEEISLIIIDSMAMHYRLELGEAIKSKKDEKIRQINREVARQMRILAEISRKQKIPVLITNQVYSEFLSRQQIEKGIKPEVNIVGGDLFKYWSKTIIELEIEGGKRKAILVKHRSIPETELNFEIKDKGIFRRGWL